MDFWNRVEALIKSQATTQEWVAGKIGAKGKRADSVSRWKTRNVIPKAADAVDIARALGTSVEYLVTGEDGSDPWIREHAPFIADCKALNKNHFAVVADSARTLANQDRQTRVANATA